MHSTEHTCTSCSQTCIHPDSGLTRGWKPALPQLRLVNLTFDFLQLQLAEERAHLAFSRASLQVLHPVVARSAYIAEQHTMAEPGPSRSTAASVQPDEDVQRLFDEGLQCLQARVQPVQLCLMPSCNVTHAALRRQTTWNGLWLCSGKCWRRVSARTAVRTHSAFLCTLTSVA